MAAVLPYPHGLHMSITVPRTSYASLAKLAKAAGVSTSTVSRALAGSPLISAATRERIVQLAEEHSYRPNQLARSLRLRRTNAVGVVVPLGHEVGQHVSDPFFMTLLGHLADALTERGYDLLLSRVIPTSPAWLDRITESGRVDGVIVIGQSDQADVLDGTADRFGPLVVWGARLEGRRHVTVGTDNRLGGALATRHLLDTGRRRLAFFGNPLAPEIALRQQGFFEACAERGLGGVAETVPVPLTPDRAYDMVVDHLARTPPPDGIVAESDVVAMSAIRALTERGLRVPEDVGIVGFDDVPLAAHTTPPLTTVRQDLRLGAARLVELLLRKLAGEAVEPVVLVPELVVRGST